MVLLCFQIFDVFVPKVNLKYFRRFLFFNATLQRAALNAQLETR